MISIISELKNHKAIIAITILGYATYIFWTPLTDIFYKGTFHTNIELAIQTKSIKLAENKNLVSINVVATNNGSVPLDINDKHAYVLEVKRIIRNNNYGWVSASNLQDVGKIFLLDGIPQHNKHETIETLEPNSVTKETQSIILPNGVYSIHAKLNAEGGSDFFESTELIKVPEE